MSFRILVGDWVEQLRQMPSESVHCVVTSPPYWGLRDYGVPGQLGLEPTPAEYIRDIVSGFAELRRVLRSDGTLWLNMGDSYATGAGAVGNCPGGGRRGERWASMAPMTALNRMPIEGLKTKDLIGMPWRIAFALQANGWYLRQDIIWNKTNVMPESVTDRCTKAHEYIFLLTKSETYYFDSEAIKEPASTNTHNRGGGINPKATVAGQHSRMRADRDPRHLRAPRSKQNESFSGAVSNGIVTHRNKRSVWTMATSPFRGAHFATFPPSLPKLCIAAGTSECGCCPTCGRQFRRIVETYDTGRRDKMPDGWDTAPGQHTSVHREGREKGKPNQPVLSTRTIGWKQECCSLFDFEAQPCVVLDPFAGAGTTGAVAIGMGRSFIGIELNPQYAEMAIGRIEAVI